MLCLMKNMLKISALIACFLLMYVSPCLAEIQLLEDKPAYALSVYGGRMTDNKIDNFAVEFLDLDYEDSYLLTMALARRFATYDELASFELEGQAVKHFDQQDHWEFNALLTARWEAFFFGTNTWTPV